VLSHWRTPTLSLTKGDDTGIEPGVPISLSIPALLLFSRANILSHAEEKQRITRPANAKLSLSRPRSRCCNPRSSSHSFATAVRLSCQHCHSLSHITPQRNNAADMTTTRDSTRAESLEPGEIVEVLTAPQEGQWCKVFTSKTTNAEGREYYFSNLETGESSWEEPRAAYWLWDHGTQHYHVSGLQQPTSKETRKLLAHVSHFTQLTSCSGQGEGRPRRRERSPAVRRQGPRQRVAGLQPASPRPVRQDPTVLSLPQLARV
jgi:hypothetical protein